MMPDLSTRRARIAASLPLGDAVLLVAAGEPVPLPEGSDQTYPFRAHADYLYLAGQETPGGVLALDPRGGGWRSFVPPVTEAERVWEGREQPAGEPIAELEPWLHARRNRTFAGLGAPLRQVSADPVLSADVRAALLHARRPKDETEIARLRRAAAATAAGYARLRELIRPGTSERTLQIELEAEFFRAGAASTGYHTLVGSGPRSAVLHCQPSARKFRTGEFVLVDAGAEVERYTADVTRTWVVGEPQPLQRDLHGLVCHAQARAVARCVAGAEWKELHLAAAVDLAAGLVDLGVLRGSAESLVEREAHTLFFPHGLGHMVGLGVRDAGGLAPGRQRDPRASLRNLRMDLPLAPGYVVTVEPGLYFIPALLNDPARRARFRDDVDWALVDRHPDLGGVRIEDNVLVTAGAPEVLTAAIGRTLVP